MKQGHGSAHRRRIIKKSIPDSSDLADLHHQENMTSYSLYINNQISISRKFSRWIKFDEFPGVGFLMRPLHFVTSHALLGLEINDC